MSGIIKHLIYIDNEGDIKMVKPAKGINPEEGSVDANGWTIKYMYEELSPSAGGWMDTHYWDGEKWATRSKRPNGIATWVGGRWIWSEEGFKDLVRYERNRKLAMCDWAMLPDVALTDEEKEEVRTYRANLRNIPQAPMPESGLIEDVVWPSVPSTLVSIL